MVVEQLPGQVREFARYLNGLLARLDQGAGWCGVFWQRDPDGMRACLEGREVPPWDVVEALLQDLAAHYATGAVTPEAEQARLLHQASLAAFDARPGARDTLGDRLDVMLREQRYAAERLAELGRLLGSAATHEEAEGLRLDLAWAHDDHERASARCVELRYRLDQLARRTMSRAPSPRRDRDEEADLFAGRVQHAPPPADPHNADPLTLPGQRTDRRSPDDDTATRYDERGTPRQGADGRPSAGYETGRGSRRQTSDGSGPTPYDNDRAPGRQDSSAETSAWHDDRRRTDAPDSPRHASHGDEGGPGRQVPDTGEHAWRGDSREDERGGTGRATYGDDRAPGRQVPDTGGHAWRDDSRADERGGARPAPYGGDGGAGRQVPDTGGHAWREDSRAEDRAAPYGDDRAPGPQGFGGEVSDRRDGSRRAGRADDDGARPGDDRGPGRPGSDDALRPWRGHTRRSGGADDQDGPRPADAPETPEPSAERSAPQLPADWYQAPAEAPPADPRPAPKQRSKRRTRGSARFAGAMDDADTGSTPVVDPTPASPAPAASGRRTPRGARFAGAAAAAKPATPVREALDDDARHDTIDAVRSLVRLRSEGRSGEAHALLVEAAHWPAARFPLLAAELHRAGLGADWATLLWEAASLPADRLVAAADALVAAGRGPDGRQILRQGIVRPAQEVGEAVLQLAEDGRQREVRALLDAYVRVRAPEEAARSVAADPQRLVPLLLEAARGASEDCYWDLVHALRVAGHSA